MNRIDAWVGILAEDHLPGSSVGPTADAVITDQFVRLRDGDRFWYQNDRFDPQELAAIESTTLAEVLRRNTGVAGLQDKIFFAERSWPALSEWWGIGTRTSIRCGFIFSTARRSNTVRRSEASRWPADADGDQLK